ncbi:uncharacterized protein BDZ99DRAFT_470746 [Mytilinidion resinicola]|uniref:Ankyrin n=1 Tax=Mytilinidion resinicola TaxID=574789 RepID=A0A6A6Z9T0_9PEZI|nr:uncharacterized protein BDZ99DRAFT_470746 [Mytilinidion resinicola]KAF2817790.1 hypothetical protein BDZ99DRAFT_470746 [Mytilinidion resinicola]
MADRDGTTPLHTACCRLDMHMTELCIKYQIEVNVLDTRKRSALHRLVSRPATSKKQWYDDRWALDTFKTIFGSLIENGIDIHLKDENGNTALDLAKLSEDEIASFRS